MQRQRVTARADREQRREPEQVHVVDDRTAELRQAEHVQPEQGDAGHRQLCADSEDRRHARRDQQRLGHAPALRIDRHQGQRPADALGREAQVRGHASQYGACHSSGEIRMTAAMAMRSAANRAAIPRQPPGSSRPHRRLAPHAPSVRHFQRRSTDALPSAP